MQFSHLWNLLKTTATIWGPFVSGLIAAFIAAFIVHLLTQSRERERWILDCKKQEFKELLSAVSASWQATIRTFPPLRVASEEERQRVYLITEDCLRIMRDRLYITEDLPGLDDLSNRWSEALATYARRQRLDAEFVQLRNTIIDAANKKAVPKTPMQKLKFWKR